MKFIYAFSASVIVFIFVLCLSFFLLNPISVENQIVKEIQDAVEIAFFVFYYFFTTIASPVILLLTSFNIAYIYKQASTLKVRMISCNALVLISSLVMLCFSLYAFLRLVYLVLLDVS